MSQPPEETKRLQSLLTSLIILSVVILAMILAIAAYPTIIRPAIAPATPVLPTLASSRTPTPIPSITQTPTQTGTLRPTFTPTITLTPTETLPPTGTPTPAGPATLTPARPVLGDPYRLAEWTAEQADYAAQLMNDYPNTLSVAARGEDSSAFYKAFSYSTIALREALIRFPDEPYTTRWEAQLAYSLARISSPDAGQAYADLITRALNQEEANLNNLPEWFVTTEPRLRLNMTPLQVPEGYTGSYLVEIHGPGSAFLWLLETPSGYQAKVIQSNFGFTEGADMRSIVSDLNRDGFDDVAIYNLKPSDTELEKPNIFDLSTGEIQELSFQPSGPALDLGMEYRNYWRVIQDAAGNNQLQLELSLFPVCPVTLQRSYNWDGEYFEAVSERVNSQPAADTLSTCQFIVEHAINLWGPSAAVQIMEPILPVWPPETDENGKEFPADAKDEWRYRLGIYQALSEDYDRAVETLNDLVSHPTIPTSQWVKPANEFLQAYQKPEQIYTACLQSSMCDPNLALGSLLNKILPPAQDPVEFMWQSGAALNSNGYFDFDNDGQSERWFTIQHRPLERLNLWILASTTEGLNALHVGALEGGQVNPQYLDDSETSPLVWIEEGTYFHMQRDPQTSTPYLVFASPRLTFPDRFKEGMNAVRETLLIKGDATEALRLLEELKLSPGLLCKATWSCDEYYYLLGLANEISGNDRAAIDAYLRLWWDYSKSPFTILARLKLIGTMIPPTATASTTPTVTPTGFFATTPAPTQPYPITTPTGFNPYPYPYPTETPYNPYP